MKTYLPVILITTCLGAACGDAAPESMMGTVERAKYGLNEAAQDPNAALPNCDDVSTWPDAATAQEDDFLPLLNAFRAQGATCGDKVMPPVGPVARNDALRCAARWHTLDMGHRNYFSHNSPEGTRASERLRAVGYTFTSMGENIAWGQRNAQAVLDAWATSPGHCMNMMDASFTEAGVGFFVKDANTSRGKLWALDLGAQLH